MDHHGQFIKYYMNGAQDIMHASQSTSEATSPGLNPGLLFQNSKVKM